jgi:hypothetical protein
LQAIYPPALVAKRSWLRSMRWNIEAVRRQPRRDHCTERIRGSAFSSKFSIRCGKHELSALKFHLAGAKDATAPKEIAELTVTTTVTESFVRTGLSSTLSS